MVWPNYLIMDLFNAYLVTTAMIEFNSAPTEQVVVEALPTPTSEQVNLFDVMWDLTASVITDVVWQNYVDGAAQRDKDEQPRIHVIACSREIAKQINSIAEQVDREWDTCTVIDGNSNDSATDDNSTDDAAATTFTKMARTAADKIIAVAAAPPNGINLHITPSMLFDIIMPLSIRLLLQFESAAIEDGPANLLATILAEREQYLGIASQLLPCDCDQAEDKNGITPHSLVPYAVDLRPASMSEDMVYFIASDDN